MIYPLKSGDVQQLCGCLPEGMSCILRLFVCFLCVLFWLIRLANTIKKKTQDQPSPPIDIHDIWILPHGQDASIYTKKHLAKKGNPWIYSPIDVPQKITKRHDSKVINQ